MDSCKRHFENIENLYFESVLHNDVPDNAARFKKLKNVSDDYFLIKVRDQCLLMGKHREEEAVVSNLRLRSSYICVCLWYYKILNYMNHVQIKKIY